MSALRLLLLLLAGLACAASPTQAADGDEPKWQTKAIADKPQVVLDPAKAYILVEADAMVLPYFMRVPSVEEAATHARNRSEELARERAKWDKKHASWQRQIEGLKRSPSSSPRPTEPLEPTEENFGWPRYEMSHPVAIGPQNRFSKTDGSVYLQEVPPGDYLYYGNYNGLGVGTCACLGTASFNAPAGKVVALRMRLPFLEALQSEPKDRRPKNALDLPPGITSLRLEPGASTDPRLPAAKIIPARLVPAGPMPNFFGIEVDRLTAIDGVFAYERDKQVDLRGAPPMPAASSGGQ